MIVMRSIDYLWIYIDPKFSEGGLLFTTAFPSLSTRLWVDDQYDLAYVIPILTVGNFPDNGRSVFSYHNIN